MRTNSFKLLAPLLFLSLISNAANCPASQHPTFTVAVAPGLSTDPVSGRLIVMITNQPLQGGRLVPSFGPSAHSVWVAAKEITNLTPQNPAMLDPDELAYPDAFCMASAGSYKVRAVLDVNHNFAYDYNSSDGDLESEIVDQTFNPSSADVISVTLTKRKVDLRCSFLLMPSCSTSPVPCFPNSGDARFIFRASSCFRQTTAPAIVAFPPFI